MEKEITVIGNKEEIIIATMKKFMPMNESEQQLFLFVLISSYLECMEGIKNSKNKQQKDHWFYQKETYDFILRMFTKPPKELEEQGYNAKAFILNQAKKEYDKLFKKGIDA